MVTLIRLIAFMRKQAERDKGGGEGLLLPLSKSIVGGGGAIFLFCDLSFLTFIVFMRT